MSETNFDLIYDRRGTGCAKWDEMDEKYGSEDMIHLAVADMDFPAPSPVRKRLSEVITHGIFGYTNLEDSFYTSIQGWLKRQIGVEIPTEWIVYCSRINVSASLTIAALTEPGDKVLLHSPCYMPLHNAVTKNNRELLLSPLQLHNKRYEMDFEQMEELVDERTRMVILCNPHNPCLRSWNRDELERLADFCNRHDLILFSDEIHSDIRPKGAGFTSALHLGDELRNRLVYASSPTKTFNIPGLIFSYLIIPNQELRQKFQAETDRVGIHNPNAFTNAAISACYKECDSWLLEVNQYIDDNERFVRNYMETSMPEFQIYPREGTYLLWIDCRAFQVSDQELEHWFTQKARVGVYMGNVFGPHGQGFIRWNLGTSRQLLKEALDRMNNVYHHLKKEKKR